MVFQRFPFPISDPNLESVIIRESLQISTLDRNTRRTARGDSCGTQLPCNRNDRWRRDRFALQSLFLLPAGKRLRFLGGLQLFQVGHEVEQLLDSHPIGEIRHPGIRSATDVLIARENTFGRFGLSKPV